VSGVVKVAW